MTLRLGDKGDDVRALQGALNTHGAAPPLTADGNFGPWTLAALRAFQKRTPGLTVDGIAGPRTFAALGIHEASPPSAPAPLEVPRVRIPIPLADLAHAFRSAWTARFQAPPFPTTLRMALAHLRLEHGVEPAPPPAPAGSLQLKATYCYNLGNLMAGGKWRGHWFRLDAAERESGRSVVHHSHWRAYPNLVVGVNGYLGELVNDFPHMLAAFPSGDAAAVARGGRADGYYTDEETDYAKKLGENYAATDPDG